MVIAKTFILGLSFLLNIGLDHTLLSINCSHIFTKFLLIFADMEITLPSTGQR